MTQAEPKIVIGICTYNRAPSLKRCLDSLQHLKYTNFEIVVIDNNSSDNTKDVILAFANVKYIFEQRQGIAYARNAVLDYCGNVADLEYLGFIDDDETVSENWALDMLSCFMTNEKIAVVTGAYLPVYEIEPPEWIPDGLHNAYENKLEVNTVYKKFSVLTGNCLAKYDVIKKKSIRFDEMLGRKGELLLSREDTEFFRELVEPDFLYGFTHNAYINHYIEKERLTFAYCIKRCFYEGVSEYYCKDICIVLKSIFKIIIQLLRLFITCFTLNNKMITRRFLKVVKTSGIIWGPFSKLEAL